MKEMAIRITIAVVLSFAVAALFANHAYAQQPKGWTVYGVVDIIGGEVKGDGIHGDLGMRSTLAGVGVHKAVRHHILKGISAEFLVGQMRSEWEHKHWSNGVLVHQTPLLLIHALIPRMLDNPYARGWETANASKLRLNANADLYRWSDGRGVVANLGYEHSRMGELILNTGTIRIGYQF